MVGLVVVSHSRELAEGVVALAREMGGEEVAIEPAGGLDDPPDAVGTDAVRVQRAIERVRGEAGVLVLMDLGSALMSAEMAVEMAAGDGPVLLSEAPLVEGAIAAAARARGGASLDEVAAEARGALRMKAEQLGAEDEPDERAAERPAAAAGDAGAQLRVTLDIPLGLHARPAARVAGVAGRFGGELTVENATRGRGPADARSLTGLALLAARHGDELVFRAGGEQAQDALAALRELAGEHFGDEPGPPAGAAAGGAPAPAERPAREPRALEPPAAGTRLTGVPAATGIAIGPAQPLAGEPLPEPPERAPGAPEAERARLDRARAAAREDIARDRDAVARRAGDAEAAILDAHAALLDDAALLEPAHRAIAAQGATAERAWRDAAAAAARSYRELDDPYLRERAVDVEDVGGRVLARLAGREAPADAPAGVVVAGELTPGQAARLDPARVRGIATAHGGATSHAAILARALGIPAVVGLGDALLAVEPGTELVLDGGAGTVDVAPGPDAVAAAREQAAAAGERARELRTRAREPGRTRDGARVEVFANLGAPREAAAAVDLGAEGVGLLRTEFLFQDREAPPSEEEQEAVYREIAEALDGRPLVLRTLDAGADKPLPFLRQAPEANPFLGRRGIRLSLAEPELLSGQLRAAARVAADHPVKVMFPMVATVAEYRAGRALAADAGAPEGMEVGIMVEVPAVALQAERFAREVDFFSVGTNDLSQYAMAAERGNEQLSELLDGPLPAVLRLIAGVVDAAGRHGRWVGVCGELAGDPEAAILLAGLGVRELSMAASRIPELKATLREVELPAARAAAAEALDAEDARSAAALAEALRR